MVATFEHWDKGERHAHEELKRVQWVNREARMRKFDSGATRDSLKTFDPEGFINPRVLKRYCEYMERHRTQADGTVRDSDNWTKGIPKQEYMKSLIRHVLDAWDDNRMRYLSQQDFHDLFCAIIFNAMGFLYEEMNGR